MNFVLLFSQICNRVVYFKETFNHLGWTSWQALKTTGNSSYQYLVNDIECNQYLLIMFLHILLYLHAKISFQKYVNVKSHSHSPHMGRNSMLGFKKHSINNISGMTTVNCHQIYFYHVTNFINVEFKVSKFVNYWG